jgi:hypothetical protein
MVMMDDSLTQMKEIGKLCFRVLDRAHAVIDTIEPESDSERESLDQLLTDMQDVSMSLFTVCRLPTEEAARWFYQRNTFDKDVM